MESDEPTVIVVDDDPAVRKALARLLRSSGYAVEAHATARGFLEASARECPGPSCAILDVQLPDWSGMDLAQELARKGSTLPIVFLTGHGDIPMGVRAMKEGAVDFLTKPVDDEALLDAVRRAHERDARARAERRGIAEARGLVAGLTPREREVLRWVIAGKLNKQIAGALGIAEKTVKVHRGRVMAKCGVQSVAELVRLAERAGIPPA